MATTNGGLTYVFRINTGGKLVFTPEAQNIVNLGVAPRGATAIFLQFPIEATNSGTCE